MLVSVALTPHHSSRLPSRLTGSFARLASSPQSVPRAACTQRHELRIVLSPGIRLPGSEDFQTRSQQLASSIASTSVFAPAEDYLYTSSQERFQLSVCASVS